MQGHDGRSQLGRRGCQAEDGDGNPAPTAEPSRIMRIMAGRVLRRG